MTDLVLHPDWDNETIRPYWEGFQDQEIRIPTCEDCGEFHWYPLEQCPHCASEAIAWEPIDGPTTLFTWVEVTYDFGQTFYEDQVPLYSGLIVPADDESIRLPALIDTEEPPEIGMELTVEFEENGDVTKFPVYRPA